MNNLQDKLNRAVAEGIIEVNIMKALLEAHNKDVYENTKLHATFAKHAIAEAINGDE